MKGLIILFLSYVFLSASVVTTNAKNVVCYVADWTIGRPGRGRFDIDNIDANLCTHVNYAFVGLTDNYDIKLPDRGDDGINKLQPLKNINPNLKTMVALGGYEEGSERFSRLVSSSESRGQFIRNAIKFMEKYHLDGLDLDWEYPTQREGSSSQDVPNFTAFVKELKNSFSNRYLLTAAVPSSEWSASGSYNISGICSSLDYINLMAYDLHNAGDPVTGMQAGLYGPGKNDKDTVNAGVLFWINNDCPAEKINLGVPFYGKTWTLVDPNNNGVGAPASGPGTPGPISAAAGSLTYFEICEKINNGWTVKFDEVRRVPYAFQGDQWIGYENVQSLTEKVQYAKDHQLAGMMVWEINDDDFTGFCGEKYPLLNTLYTINN